MHGSKRHSATSQPSKPSLPRHAWIKLKISVHSATLGAGQKDDTLAKIKQGDLNGKGEVAMVFGKQDTHVDRKGRTLIRETLDDAGVSFTVSLPLDLPYPSV